MMFNEDVSAELQDILEIELHRYKREIGHMTKEEWNLLVNWVYSGHSPYTNGDGVFDDDGWPLDFINTLRSWNEMQEYSDSLDDEISCDYADLPDGNDFDFPEDFLNATDLPF
jgi:hypothetical protein